jgi:hypothetical protein
MEFKISASTNNNSILRIVSERLNISIDELFSKGIVTARVLERLGANQYLLNFSGKQLKLFSEAKLFLGENLNLKVLRDATSIQLEIQSRALNTKESDVEVKNAWAKNYFSPARILHSAIDPSQGEISFQKLYQYMEVFFPGIEWNSSVSQFDWKFQDGEANGFFGKKKDAFAFYFHFESRSTGAVDSYFYWKNEDLSDLVLHSIFGKLSVYSLANEKLFELKKMLSSYSIIANDIIFHYSTIYRDKKGDWIA